MITLTPADIATAAAVNLASSCYYKLCCKWYYCCGQCFLFLLLIMEIMLLKMVPLAVMKSFTHSLIYRVIKTISNCQNSVAGFLIPNDFPFCASFHPVPLFSIPLDQVDLSQGLVRF